jgi:hypothetical protein
LGLQPQSATMPLTFTAAWVDFTGAPHSLEVVRTSTRFSSFEIDFGDLPVGEVAADGYVTLSVEDGLGQLLERNLAVNFAREHSVAYDGNVRTAELYTPVQVSSCIPGGPYGKSVSYTGGSSENRSRSVTTSVNVGISAWVFTAGFGMSVTETISSDESESLSMSGTVHPNQYGVFYRQTERLERKGQIVKRAACGADTVVGTASVTDWNWAPDLAITTNGTCPPAPKTNLPAAQVFP